jgi:hypothetical protein
MQTQLTSPANHFALAFFAAAAKALRMRHQQPSGSTAEKSTG